MDNYDNYTDLVDDIKQEYTRRLVDEIKPIVFDILRKHIQTDIYDVYTPRENGWVEYDEAAGKWRRWVTYKRRYGLLDTGKEYYTVEDNSSGNAVSLTLFATIDEQVSPFPRKHAFKYSDHGAFLKLLEVGRLGIFTAARFGGSPFPRPAVSNAQAEIDKDPRIKAIINRAVN